MTDDTVLQFADLFSGNRCAFGRFEPSGGHREDGKLTGKCSTITANITKKQYDEHLAGFIGLGICPVNQDGKCAFSVIDIDVYDASTTIKYLELIKKWGFPLVPFRSKSGGLHLYTFYKEPISAKDAIAVAKRMVFLLGLPQSTEVFPKQSTLASGQSGNWINLPYFGGDDAPNALYNEQGQLYNNVAMALGICVNAKTTLSGVRDWVNSLPLNDAPPCLQALYLSGDVELRNNYLFSFGVYAKSKHKDGFEEAIVEANNALAKPLSVEELEKTVLQSLRKNTYKYRCKEAPICAYCDKQVCAKRQYGLGANTPTVNLEQLTVVKSDPPSYIWTVDGKELKCENIDKMLSQSTFRKLCAQELDTYPAPVKEDVWASFVTTALHNKVEVIPPEAEIHSTTELWKEQLLAYFMTADPNASKIGAVTANAPMVDVDGTLYIRSSSVLKYLSDTVHTEVPLQMLAEYLKALGFTATIKKIGIMTLRVWGIPMRALFNSDNEYAEWNSSKTATSMTQMLDSLHRAFEEGEF